MPVNDEVSMFYNAKPHIFDKAKTLRLHMTEAENLLWERLNKKQILGLHFRAQHPIDIFIADFYCHKIKLVVEVDGGIHKTKDLQTYDIGRTAEMEEYGIKVMRFTNEEIFNSLNEVVEKIKTVCREMLKNT